MGRSRRKDNDTEENEKTLKELKAANRRLKSDNERLKQELATLRSVFDKTSKYLKDNTDNFSVESLIRGAKNEATLEQIKITNSCYVCKSTKLKELNVPFGKIMLCTDCNHSKVVRDGKEEKE
jgi:predicted nuclease with TOPRIM domain